MDSYTNKEGRNILAADKLYQQQAGVKDVTKCNYIGVSLEKGNNKCAAGN